MNERIKELAVQSGMGPWGIGNGDNVTEIVERFAELIINECTELTLDYKSESHYNGWIDYRDEVKKHFGVE